MCSMYMACNVHVHIYRHIIAARHIVLASRMLHVIRIDYLVNEHLSACMHVTYTCTHNLAAPLQTVVNVS